MNTLTLRRRLLSLAAAVLLICWGGLGLYQGLHRGFTGGIYDPNYTVPGVIPGSAADKAGFKTGDRVISVEGRPVEELGMESRWPRSLEARVGQSHRFVVERKGESISLDLVYEPPFRAAVNSRFKSALFALAFLWFGLWALLTTGTAPALTLANVGLAAGVAMAAGFGPSLGLWKGVKDHVSTAATALMFILLLRFFLIFPKEKAIGRSRVAAWLVYGAWACLIGFLFVELLTHPVFYYTTGSVAGPLMMVYVLLILAAIIHTWWETPRAELRQSGMYLILGGLLVSLVLTAADMFSGLDTPGWVSGLFIIPVPLTMALAVRKQA